MKFSNLTKADVLFVFGSVILMGFPSTDLLKTSSGGGAKSMDASAIFDIITFPELSSIDFSVATTVGLVLSVDVEFGESVHEDISNKCKGKGTPSLPKVK